MKLKWEAYWYALGTHTLRNVGTVGTTWLTMNGLNGAGVDVPQMNLQSLGWALLVAGVLGSVFAFWSKTPLPDVETTTVTVETVKTKDTRDEKTDVGHSPGPAAP